MKKLGIQEILSIGYLYLLVLGIITETIFYKILGINIIKYSEISDILLFPIYVMASNVLIPLILGLLILIIYIYYKILAKKKRVDEAQHQMKMGTNNKFIILGAQLFFLLFLGLEIGRGIKIKNQMNSGNMVSDHTIKFADNHVENVKIVGQNAGYLFFIRPNEKVLVVGTIPDHILEIKRN